MDSNKQIKTLQNTYVAVLAETVTNYTKLGIFDQVTDIKNQTKNVVGKMQLNVFGIRSEKDVFMKLSEIFDCANWKLTETHNGFDAVATGCKLCALTKKMGGNSPCNIYCLYPMMGMLNSINPKAKIDVKSTLWDNTKCNVCVKWE